MHADAISSSGAPTYSCAVTVYTMPATPRNTASPRAILAYRLTSRSLRVHGDQEVEHDVDRDGHHDHEVPVDGHGLGRLVPDGGELARDRSGQDHHQEHDPARHVGQGDPRHDVEQRAEQTVRDAEIDLPVPGQLEG